MGDRRYAAHLDRVLDAPSPLDAIREMADVDVVQALAALSARPDPRSRYLANVLATEALNRMERARTIALYAEEGLVTVDADGVCTAANPAAAVLLGWSEDELRGHDLHELAHYEGRDGTATRRSDGPVHRAIAERAVVRERIVLTRRDGSKFEASVAVAPFLRDGDVSGAVVAMHAVDG